MPPIGVATSSPSDRPKQDTEKFVAFIFKESGSVSDLQGADNSILHIYSRKVLKMIVSGEEGWEEYVPKEISKTINEKCLFGHPCEFEN